MVIIGFDPSPYKYFRDDHGIELGVVLSIEYFFVQMGDPQVTIGFNTKIVKSWMILDTSILGHLDTNILRMIVDYHDPINWESTNQFYFGMTWGCEHCSHEQR